MIRVLQTLPESMKSMETHRLTIAFFAVSSLDILGVINNLSNPTCEEIIDWVYSLQAMKV
jgi:geranylgeranyl transferase type-1 subunit beta